MHGNETVTSRLVFLMTSMSGGGAERVVIELLRHMDRKRFRLSLAMFNLSGDYLPLIPDDVSIIDLSGNTGRRNTLNRIWAIRRFVTEHRPDAVISGLPMPNYSLLRAAPLMNHRCRIVITEHNNISTQLSKRHHGIWLRLKKLETRFLYRWADRVVAVSQGVKGDLIREFGAAQDRVSVIYDPIDLERLRHAASASIHSDISAFLSDDVKVIVAAGRLVPQKGYQDLIEAFAQVRNRLSCKLLILGQGPLREELEAQVETLGLTDYVCMPGFSHNPWALMARADLYASSSHWEGFHMTIVEAMACGTPVVATDCDYGPREIIEDGKNGLLVPVGDIEQLAGCIIELLTNDVMAAGLARAGLQRARDFDSPAICEQYENLLCDLLV